MSTEEERQLSKRVHDRAKVAAMRDLVDIHRGEYELLRSGWVEHYKAELGWTDRRAEANREREVGRGQARDDSGRFASTD